MAWTLPPLGCILLEPKMGGVMLMLLAVMIEAKSVKNYYDFQQHPSHQSLCQPTCVVICLTLTLYQIQNDASVFLHAVW